MDDLTPDEFRKLFPAFSDAKYTDEEIQAAIDLAALNFNPCVWGDKMKVGQAYWVAHWLTMYGSAAVPPMAAPSPATSKKVGDTAVTYSDAIAEERMKNPYLWTPYGQQYWFMVTHLAGVTITVV